MLQWYSVRLQNPSYSICVNKYQQLPFEIMCYASDYAVGAVLGQIKDKKHHASAYAIKTMTRAQLN